MRSCKKLNAEKRCKFLNKNWCMVDGKRVIGTLNPVLTCRVYQPID